MLSPHQDLHTPSLACHVKLYSVILAFHSLGWGSRPCSRFHVSGLVLRILSLGEYSSQSRAQAQPVTGAWLGLAVTARQSLTQQLRALAGPIGRPAAEPNHALRAAACLLGPSSPRKGTRQLPAGAYAARAGPAQKALDFTVSDTLVRLLEHELGTRINFTLLRSPYSLISATEVVSLLLLRGRINFWLQPAQGSPTWRYIATLIFMVFKTKDISLLTS